MARSTFYADATGKLHTRKFYSHTSVGN